MHAKHFIFILLLISVLHLDAQDIEEQRKYAIPDLSAFSQFITNSESINGFSTFNHSEFIYLDIYLDTPDFILFKNQLSLRFRKRILSEDSVSYGMQLKSEMTNEQPIRMEVEETELDFYKIKTADGWVSLTIILDILFDQLEQNSFDANSTKTVEAIKTIQEWISFKSEGVITPFQKLLALYIPGLDANKLQQITPVLCGIEERKRSHIFIDQSKTIPAYQVMNLNRVPASLTPTIFIANPQFNWVMESSLDSAVFYPIFQTLNTAFHIYEFEVENKYFIPAQGTKLMNDFEIALQQKFGIVNHMESKYRTSMIYFLNE